MGLSTHELWYQQKFTNIQWYSFDPCNAITLLHRFFINISSETQIIRKCKILRRLWCVLIILCKWRFRKTCNSDTHMPMTTNVTNVADVCRWIKVWYIGESNKLRGESIFHALSLSLSLCIEFYQDQLKALLINCITQKLN